MPRMLSSWFTWIGLFIIAIVLFRDGIGFMMEPLAWNIGYFGVPVVLLIIGWVRTRKGDEKDAGR